MLHSTQPTSSFTPSLSLPVATSRAAPAPSVSATQLTGHSAHGSARPAAGRRVTAATDTRICKSSNPLQHCQLPNRSEQEGCHQIRAGRMRSGRFCSNNCSFLSIFLFFCLLPCSGTGSSSSLPARCLTAPACGNRGNYSKRSRKTDTHHQRGTCLHRFVLCTHTAIAACYVFICVCVKVYKGQDARCGYGPSSVTWFVQPGQSSHPKAEANIFKK